MNDPSGLAPAVRVIAVTHRYGGRVALDAITLDVLPGELFGLLGPNGSGKTTLFRLICTLMAPTAGRITVFGRDVVSDRDAVRQSIGVVFQSPGLDKQLTAVENLRHHGHLYGLRGADLRKRIDAALASLGMLDRAAERIGTLSGGMRRRVEIAKGLLTRPRLLLMDEPSTGLDPAARIDLWHTIDKLRSDGGVSVILTTHLMDEADRCCRLGILADGKLAACDSPETLKGRIGGDVVTLRTRDPVAVIDRLRVRFDIESRAVDGTVRFERERGHEFIPAAVDALSGLLDSVSVGRPTLEDVFVRLTGNAFEGDADPEHPSRRRRPI